MFGLQRIVLPKFEMFNVSFSKKGDINQINPSFYYNQWGGYGWARTVRQWIFKIQMESNPKNIKMILNHLQGTLR